MVMNVFMGHFSGFLWLRLLNGLINLGKPSILPCFPFGAKLLNEQLPIGFYLHCQWRNKAVLSYLSL
jgi:hypothetical protein